MLRRRPAREGVHRAGIPVDPALVKAALPGGDTLSAATVKPNGGTVRCNLSVDGKEALSLAQAWWSQGQTTATVSQGYSNTDDGVLSEDGRFVHTEKAGVGRTVSSVPRRGSPPGGRRPAGRGGRTAERA
nr:hypothetical protein OG499_10640 [Streptomyces anulatus]